MSDWDKGYAWEQNLPQDTNAKDHYGGAAKDFVDAILTRPVTANVFEFWCGALASKIERDKF